MAENREETSTIQGGRWEKTHIGAAKTGGEVDTAIKTAAAGTTAGKGLGSKGKALGSGAPKMSDYPGDVKGYSEAMRKYRAEQAEGQSKALAGKQ